MIIINLIYPIFTALVETKVSQIEHIHTYIHINTLLFANRKCRHSIEETNCHRSVDILRNFF